jgi:hypothetical protein
MQGNFFVYVCLIVLFTMEGNAIVITDLPSTYECLVSGLLPGPSVPLEENV